MQRNWIGRSEGAEFELPVAGRGGPRDHDLHHASRHLVRHDLRGAGARAPAGGPPRVGPGRGGAQVTGVPAGGRARDRDRAAGRRPAEARAQAQGARHQSVHGEGDPALPRGLRAHGLRHGRHHGRARGRPARLGLREAVRPRDHRDGQDGRRAGRTRRRIRGTASRSIPASSTGCRSMEAKRKAIDWLVAKGIGRSKVNYRLRDWGISRQRYWGAPIPILYCESCGMVPENGREPARASCRRTCRSAARAARRWPRSPRSSTPTCPKCGGRARRDTDTMDTFVESSWYFLRYCSPALRAGNVRAEGGRVLDAGRPVHRRDRARGAAPAVRALLHQSAARSWHDQARRALRRAPLAGYGDQGRRQDVQVQGQCRGSGRHDPPVRSRRDAALHAVCGAAGAGPRMDGERRGGGLALPEPALALRARACRRRSRVPVAFPARSRTPAAPSAGSSTKPSRRVTSDVERDFHFNTAISAVMELVNALHDFERDSLDRVGRGAERGALLREAVDDDAPAPRPGVPAHDRGAVAGARTRGEPLPAAVARGRARPRSCASR